MKTADFADAFTAFQQAQDLEQKIAWGERALALEQALTSWPLEEPRERVRGELWFNLGTAYFSRAAGVRADNLEKAISLLESALTVFTRETAPLDWVATNNNLAGAYQGRVRGEIADNQDRAISHFEAALAVVTLESYPLQWAQLQNNIGVVYWRRVRGVRADNIETAIKHLEAALTVFTRETHPNLWSAAENNLGTAYNARVRGEAADNQKRAIEHIEAALTIFTREATPREWAQAQNNLANAYLARVDGERAQNQEMALAHLASALTVFTKNAFPEDWATTQRSLGNAYSARIAGAREGNRAVAAAAYEAALSVFSREASPREHFLTARNLGRVQLEAGEWSKAGLTLGGARDAFLLLFGQGLDEANTTALVAEAGPMFADAAYAAVQRGENDAAVRLASEGRARLMAVTMKLQTLALAPEEHARLDGLRTAIKTAQQAVDVAHGTARGEALATLVALRQDLLQLVAAGDTSTAKASSRDATQAIISEGGAIAIPIVTQFGSKLLVMTKGGADGQQIAVVDLPQLTTPRLTQLLIGKKEGSISGWIDAYFLNYRDDSEARWSEWTDAIHKLGLDLWNLLGAGLDTALRQAGVKAGARVVWMPSGWLSVLPLGLAQDAVSKRRLADDYEIVYAPSLEALTASHDQASRTVAPTLAAIVNPTGDLPGTEKEGALVAAHFAGAARSVLVREAATAEAVIAALKGKTYWHFASHGTFSWQNARQSALVMHRADLLTVARLQDAGGLGHPRLVVLSACETGLSDIAKNPDEFIGLPGTFIALGAAGVIGTLWPVSDAATALLIAKFYELHMRDQLPPSTALHRAQVWLRGASTDDLQAYARSTAADGRLDARHLVEIEEALSPDSLSRSRNPSPVDPRSNDPAAKVSPAEKRLNARPYAHPYFWAGFIYTGL